MTRIGILGAGGMGNVHARHYTRMPDVELHFFEPDLDRAKLYIDRWDARPSVSMDDLFRVVDAVDVCLPTDLHVEIGLKAIAAGKAVLMEKPLANSLDAAGKLIEAAQKAGTPFMVGHVVRFFPEFAAGNRLVREGKIGTPAAARTRRGGLAPTGSDSWFMDHSRSGGVLIDLGIHDFDWLNWTLGPVERLYSRSVGASTGKGPDYALTTLTFDSGAIAHVESTWMDPNGYRATFEVSGSEGLIQYDSRQVQTLRTHAQGKAAQEAPLLGSDDPYFRQLRAFVAAIDGAPVAVTGVEGFNALAVAFAARESARTGKVLRPARA